MGFTGLVGTADSRAGNLIPAFAGSLSPPPPPPVLPAASFPTFVAPVMPIRHVRFATLTSGPKLTLTFPREAPTGADAAASQVDSSFKPYAHGPRTDGPFRQRLPRYKAFESYQNNPLPDPAVEIYAPFYPAINVFSPVSKFPFAPHFRPPAANPGGQLPPPPPELPPPPPPPESGVIGPSRQQVPSIPRAPAAEDQRVRPHIDKVAKLLNDLLRNGNIALDENGDFKIVGGGFALYRAPTVSDDRTVGAVLNSTFIDLRTNDVYICVNNSVGSAVWKLIG